MKTATVTPMRAILATIGAVFLAIAGAQLHAQEPAVPQVEKIALTAGRSSVLTIDFDVTRIAVTNPAIADATVVQPREVLIDGKAPGTVSLIVWGATTRRQYDVVVDPGVSTLEQRLQALFPGESLHVTTDGDAVILSGKVSSNEVSLRAAEIATAASAKLQVINLLQLPGGAGSQQVMLKVRFAEVSRNALMEIGTSLFTSAMGINGTVARTTTGQFAAPTFSDLTATKQSSNFGADPTSSSGTVTFGDFLNLFLFSHKYDIGALIRALQTRGLFQSLAEPNLIAYNGQEASFLAGGEIPVPVVQGLTNSVTIQYKEYGIRLNFVPTVAGDTIRLKVRPEVSTLDFSNAIVLSGFRIPALSTRRAETNVELRDGQSFAIAGLMNNLVQDQTDAIPGISRLPIIGHLFKSKSEQRQQTELLVLITPQLVRPLNPDEVPPLPTMQQRFLPRTDDVGEAIQGGGGVADAPPVKRP